MTRKDYEVIAAELRNEYLKFGTVDKFNDREAYGFSAACGAIAAALKSDNPRFNANKFIAVITG